MNGGTVYFLAAKLSQYESLISPEAYNNDISNVGEGQVKNFGARIDSCEQ